MVVELMVRWWRRGVLVVVVDVEDVVVQRRLRVWMRIDQWWVLVVLLVLLRVLVLVLLQGREWGNRMGLGGPGRMVTT